MQLSKAARSEVLAMASQAMLAGGTVASSTAEYCSLGTVCICKPA